MRDRSSSRAFRPSTELCASLRAAVGRFEIVECLRARTESGGVVLKLHAQGESWVLRVFGPGRGFAQALDARRRWRLDGRIAAQLRCAWPQHRASLEQWLPDDGAPVDPRALGRVLWALHDSRGAVDDDPMPLCEAWSRRVASALRSWRGPGGEVETLAAALRAGAPGPSSLRVPAHRDLRRANIRHMRGSVRLIDWEHARMDHAAVDLAAARRCLRRTEAAPTSPKDSPAWGVLLSGYAGSPPTATALRAADLLWAMGTLTWARRTQSAAYDGPETVARSREAQRILEAVIADRYPGSVESGP